MTKPELALDRPLLEKLPKVLLHDHLDGSLRPETVLELADQAGYDALPATEPEALRAWFFEGADKGNLPQYLEGFRHTIALMQTPENLERVAFESLEDLHREGVVYAELRFAPHLHTYEGLGLDAVMTAVFRGLERGRETYGIEFGLIVCALRNQSSDLASKLAELSIAWRERGCVGFDLAGEEDGHPAKHHLNAFQYIKRMNGSITIHAGESFGPESIWQALQFCGAHRIGHGTRLIEDIALYEGKVIHVGTLAAYVLDHRIPIEVCLQSNVHTGATPSLADHPFPYFLREGYRVTLNTDNRLMSKTSMTDEYEVAVREFGCTYDELERLAVNGMKSAFAPYGDRVRLIEDVIQPGYARLRSAT